MTAQDRKRARRATSLDALANGDTLLRTAGDQFGPAMMGRIHSAPDGVGSIRPLLDYMVLKQTKLRAAQFRLRYGRDYWSSEPRHPNRINADLNRENAL